MAPSAERGGSAERQQRHSDGWHRGHELPRGEQLAGSAAGGYRAGTPASGLGDPELRCQTPAPVLTFTEHAASGWFVSAFQPAASGTFAEPAPPSVKVSGDATDMEINVSGSSTSYTLRIAGDAVLLGGN